jgi:hypothetical protein
MNYENRRKKVPAKGIENMFNRVITENFPNLEKKMTIQKQESFRTLNRHDK